MSNSGGPSSTEEHGRSQTRKDGTNRLTRHTPEKYIRLGSSSLVLKCSLQPPAHMHQNSVLVAGSNTQLYSYRGQEIIPFHIPHKRLLSSLAIKRNETEPLSGYTAHQKKRRSHHDPAEYPFPLADAVVSSSSQALLNQSNDLKSSHRDSNLSQKEVIRLLRSDPGLGFYYMVYAVPQNHQCFSPYNLRIVDYSHVDKECFMTISAHGVTQYFSNEMIFTPLNQWEKEYDDYCRISKIKLFSKFRLWKAFFIWRKIITQAKFKDAQESISNNLFLLNAVLQKALLQMRQMCLKLVNIDFFDTSCMQLNQLFQFIENQMHKKESIQAQLEEYQSQFKEIISTACHEALFVEGFTAHDSNMRVSRIQLLPGQRLPPIKDGKIKMSYTDQAKKRRFCGRLTCFIHLIDLLIMDSFHIIIKNSQTSFVEALNRHVIFTPALDLLTETDTSVVLEDPRPPDAPQNPLFTTDVVCEPQALLLNPSFDVFNAMFAQIIDLWTDALVSIPTFLPDPFFMAFAEPEINGKMLARDCGNGCDLRFSLSIDERVINSKQECLHLLQKAFKVAENFIERFEFIREFLNANLAISPEELAQNQQLEVFRKHFAEFARQEDCLRKAVDSQALGLLLVKLHSLKEEVLPSNHSLRKIIEEALPRMGQEKVLTLLKEVEEKQAFLDRDPVFTKEFVDYLEFLEGVLERVEEMEAALDYCKELYDLCDEYGVRVSEQDSEEYYRFGEELGSLHRTVEKKISDKVDLVAKFVAQCQLDINELLEDIMKTHEIVMDKKFIDSNADPVEVRLGLEEIAEKVTEYQERAAEIKGYQKSFRVEVTRFELLDEVTNELRMRRLLWESLEEWDKSLASWMLSDFSSLDPEEMMEFTNKNLKNVQQMEKLLPENLIVPQFKDKVQDMKGKLPTIASLRNPNLKTRHWSNIEQLMNVRISPDETLTLQSLLDKGLINFTDQLNDIAAQASSEAALEGLLRKVEDAWQEAELVVLNHRDQKDVFILGGLEDIFALLEESLININTILSSRHVGPIKSRVEDWLSQLQLFSKTLDEWCLCQQSWLYLESIFSAPDIQRQLPAEAKMFMSVDKSWKDIMRQTAKTSLAMPACTYPGLYETFVNNNALLDQVIKCLESYLESKRVVFPRFYFLSNDELIEILAQTRNPHAVQPHLRKCFDAIAKLEFGKVGAASGLVEGDESDKLSSDIVAMVSPEGERVPLTKGLKARGNVEDWLTKVEESMFTSLRRNMKSALLSYSNSSMDVWVLNQPSQIVLTISQVMWAQTVEVILSKKSTALSAMRTFEKKNFSDLNILAGMVRGELSKLQRSVLCALITINVHARDNVSALVRSQVSERSNFEWLKQLRYYWDEDIDNCVARISTSYQVYGYEYLGACPRLVITPLTDRCYLCLMGALQLDLGGAPAGPAGTGKTETTKDLAKSLAIQCVVFNCSEGLDYKMMGRFFSGLAQSGAWCCFDEFNRIDIEVLSVIAQQIITIRNAKAANLSRFMFEGCEIKLVHQCAVFITMNPGYAGRTELPDNLKALFRPMSMMVPDYGLIAEVILYSEGFESSKILAQKMVQMYKLCSEQLSQQDHYDFGMRAVKSVLVMAGSLKRENPDVNEDVVLIRALRDSNLPKFLIDDALLFQGILKDLFPGVEIPEQDYGHLKDAVVSVMLASNLQPVDSMVTKVIQLHETCIVRHGVMLVGPTGGGKTTVLRSLGDALGELHKRGIKDPNYFPVHYYILNPKSITMGELYGEVNSLTMEWRDGLLGISVRTAVQSTNEDHQWVVCDGPVDAVWIENMNTVLDDNKMLCLANSERIKLTQYVTMLFEVQDLAQASPATVSRCGMVYVDPNDLKWLPYVQSWLCRLSIVQVEMKDYILELFSRAVDRVLGHIAKHCNQGIHQADMGKVQSLCALYEALMLEPGAIDTIADKLRLKNFLCQAFIFSALWSLGGNILEDGRDGLDICIREIFDDHPDIRLPTSGDIWGFYINISARRLEPWTKVMPTFHFDPQIPFFDLLVPTQDTVCFSYLMEKMMAVNKPVFYIGSTGVGKSVIAKSVLKNLALTDLYVPVTLNFSAQTSSSRTQEILEMRLEKRKKTLLGAPIGKKVIVFIDDVNMPKLEIYGAQPPIELLRQFLDFHGLYDREKLYWKEIRDVIITAACAPPGGGRNPLTPRFVRHFSMLLIPNSSEASLKVIFKSILKGFLADFAKPVQDLADSVVSAAVDIYRRVMEDLLPTPLKSHYVFNLRDLSKCIQGVLQADSGSLREGIDLMRLFSHECLRVFHDRLVSVEDKNYFYKLLAEMNSRSFGNPILEISEEDVIKPPVIIFGDFMNPSTPNEDRIYEEIKDISKLINVLQDYLDDYNLISTREMKLILFMDAIEHTIRIARILRAERGNGLLVGVGGMGKRSLTILGAHLNGFKCFQIELARNYNHDSFFEDLRKLYFNAGAKNEATVFLFTDTQVLEEEFLEDINNILNSGEVPGLFESDELEKVIQAVRPAAKEAGIMEHNRDGIFNFFISRVRSKLHIVLCMSPVGDSFRQRCRMFPSLVNCCTIDWFSDWPQEALLSVAMNSLKGRIEDDNVENYANICVLIHESVGQMSDRFYLEMRRHYYTTPSSYLELIKLFLELLGKKQKQTSGQRDRIANGLQKLYETNDLVAQMKVELSALGPILKEKSEATNKLMERLVKEQAQAMEVRQVVEADEAVAKVKADETQSIADDAQADLDQALPAMEAATKALEALNKNDINELKVFNKPPPLVRTVMEAVCLLLGQKTDWATAKVVLADTNFLKKLQEYDKDHIPDLTLRKLKVYIDNKDFVPDVVATQSKVCKSICLWVRAIDTYSKVYRIVEPKKKRLEQAERELAAVMAVLQEKQQKLADVEATIAKLEATYDASLSEKIELEDSIALTSARLARSASLTAALGDEQVRWEISVKMLSEELQNMTGNILVAAAYLSYLGAFTAHYRRELIKIWLQRCIRLKIPVSSDFDLILVLADPYDVRLWNSFGLPRDKISTENAILVTQAERWPLMIDPQEQANRWIRAMELKQNLKVVRLSDSNLLQTLEGAMRLGLPVLLEELGETLDPALLPILLRQTYTKSGRLLIRFADSEIDYDKNFRLYMTSKMSNPHYLPEICIQVTLINFTVTPSGLEDQLLADVVRLERPDLETQRTDLIMRINADKQQLKNIEDKILQLLFHSTGNILDDEELIETLNESKETSAIISTRLEEAESTEEKISIAREKYRTVAARGSCLYFVVAQLGEIDPMYQYSLKYFKMVFNSVIELSKKSADLNQRLKVLLSETTSAVYLTVSRGLFEKHKLVFSFLLCTSVQQQMGSVSEPQWDFLLRGSTGKKVEADGMNKPGVPAITDSMWKSVLYLAKVFPSFAELPTAVSSLISISLGNLRVDINLSSSGPSSKDWDGTLDDFSKLMLIKTLKQEKLVFAMTEYVKKKLGQTFVESPQINLNILYQDTNNITPLIFVLSAGSDPFGSFQRFAHEMGYRDKVQAISLGQGQGPIAEKMIRSASSRGEWVFLQNCHLAASWMLSLERLVQSLAEAPDKVHADFRLFLSSSPSKVFPVSVLQNSIKVTNEPPKGIRANMKRAFLEITEDFFEDNPLGPKWRKMVFGLCIFQAIIQERKKFGPLGWNIIYDFSDSDRECALLNSKLFCCEGQIPWDALEYITGEITYGGRVTDNWDQRCLGTILRCFFSKKTLETGYKFSPSGIYYCPESEHCKCLDDYRSFINNLPIIDEPEIFGMHENANIIFELNETQAIIQTILSVQPHEAAGVQAASSDDIALDVSKSIALRIMEKINADEIHPRLKKKDELGRLPSLTTVLLQEVDRFNKLLVLLHSSLLNLNRAMKGFVVMSESLEEVYSAFVNNQVPKMWAKTAYPSLKSLSSWVHDLELRLDFLQMWLTQGPPESFWLPGFFFPQGFLTGVLQTHARKYTLPIDQLLFDYEVQSILIHQDEIEQEHHKTKKEVKSFYKGLQQPDDGVYIHGIFLDAAGWDFNRKMLKDSSPGEINPPLPATLLTPRTSIPENSRSYKAPLYKTSARAGVLSTTGHSTNFIMTVMLPTDVKEDVWIMRGCALLAQLSN